MLQFLSNFHKKVLNQTDQDGNYVILPSPQSKIKKKQHGKGAPAKLFTNFYDKEYNYKYLGVRMSQNKKCDVIELIPINKGKQFAKIEILIDQSSSLIIGGNVFEKNGNKIQYDVTSFVSNAPMADAIFSFDAKKYPKVETVDLR